MRENLKSRKKKFIGMTMNFVINGGKKRNAYRLLVGKP
jgi:hypothetical protein